MSVAARVQAPAVPPATSPPSSPATTFDVGGPVAALQGRIVEELALAAPYRGHVPADGWIEGASRIAGPLALVATYAGVAALLIR